MSFSVSSYTSGPFVLPLTLAEDIKTRLSLDEIPTQGVLIELPISGAALDHIIDDITTPINIELNAEKLDGDKDIAYTIDTMLVLAKKLSTIRWYKLWRSREGHRKKGLMIQFERDFRAWALENGLARRGVHFHILTDLIFGCRDKYNISRALLVLPDEEQLTLITYLIDSFRAIVG